jgi:hypothetical protein
VLAAACAAGGGFPEGLLVVKFRLDLDGAARAAVAKAVGGKLAGPAGGAAELEYLKVPASSGLNATADRVILQNGVESVGPPECPSPQPAPAPVSPPATAPAPPASPPDSAARR